MTPTRTWHSTDKKARIARGRHTIERNERQREFTEARARADEFSAESRMMMRIRAGRGHFHDS